MIVGVTYRPPNANISNFFDIFETTVSNFIPKGNIIFCLGDFNLDLLDYNSRSTSYVFNLFEGLGLKQIINQPTRITNKSASLIDYILTTGAGEELILDAGTQHVPEVSDHELIFCKIKHLTVTSKIKYKTVRDFKHLNVSQFYSDLKSLPWNIIFELDDIDSKVDFLTDNIKTLLNIHAPLRTYKITKSYAPWLTDALKAMISDREKALKKYNRTKNPADWLNYKQIRNMVTLVVRREKKAYYADKLHNKTSKDIWTIMKPLLNRDRIKIDLPNNLSDVEVINNYFINSIPDIAPDQTEISFYKNNLKNSVQNLLDFEPVTEMDIMNIISNIKSKAVGTDEISILTIRLCIPFLLPYITHLINFCLSHSVVPTSWKKAQVIPLPKVSNPLSLNDIRLISILPALSKILEKAIEIQLQKHVHKNNIIQTTQSGFRSGHSCTTALLKITDDIFEATDKGNLTILVLLDYSKAFDTLNHQMLLSILNYIGLTESASNLLSHYLTERSQAVVYKGHTSKFLNISKGVPQGSILGPLLFSIYTSNFPSIFVSCAQHYYADDTQLYMSFNLNESVNAITALNYDLHNIRIFSKNHCLKLNAGKTTAMLFGRKSDRDKFLQSYSQCIQIDDKVIKFQDKVKNLGLCIDTDLRFSSHVSVCLQRAYANLKIIYQNRHILDRGIKSLLCDSLVLSQMNYCDVVYDPCLSRNDINRIQKLQNCCLRLIFGIRKFEHIRHTFKENNWINMRNRRYFHSVCFFIKILQSKSPPYLYNKITFRTDVHNINIRYKHALTPPIHSTQFFKRSFSYNICKCLNELPLDLKNKMSHKRLKSRILGVIKAVQQ